MFTWQKLIVCMIWCSKDSTNTAHTHSKTWACNDYIKLMKQAYNIHITCYTHTYCTIISATYNGLFTWAWANIRKLHAHIESAGTYDQMHQLLSQPSASWPWWVSLEIGRGTAAERRALLPPSARHTHEPGICRGRVSAESRAPATQHTWCGMTSLAATFGRSDRWPAPSTGTDQSPWTNKYTNITTVQFSWNVTVSTINQSNQNTDLCSAS